VKNQSKLLPREPLNNKPIYKSQFLIPPMKRIIIFSILIIISANLISAGGVGISPVHYKEFFEPGLQKSFTFQSFNTDPTKGVQVYIKGDLSEYATLSESYFVGSGKFTVTINLPQKIDKPGAHQLIVGAIESTEGGKATIGGIAAIQGRIEILVPYPGKYAEASFEINDINEGEEALYELKVNNLGTEGISVKPTIEIYKEDKSNILLTRSLNKTFLSSKKSLNIIETLRTQNLPPGEYQATATIDYGPIIEINKTFRIGEFLVEISDYDYLFEQGKINKFNVEIKNKWNAQINEIFARVSITDEGKFMTDFKTVSTSSKPWETKNLTGYFDATNLEAKRYTASITLSYDNEVSNKLVAIYVNEPTGKINYLLYSTIIGGIAVAIILIYLLIKIKRLKKLAKKRNGKRN